MNTKTLTVLAVVAALFFSATPLLPDLSLAATFDGIENVDDGSGDASGINTGGGTDFFGTLRSTLLTLLTFVGLAAVTMIIIAGIYLVVGGYNDETRGRARKIIIYTVIGILVIGLAGSFVQFMIEVGGGDTAS